VSACFGVFRFLSFPLESGVNPGEVEGFLFGYVPEKVWAFRGNGYALNQDNLKNTQKYKLPNPLVLHAACYT